MENRTFQLDTEWNFVHFPYKPTGFGILIIGDERNFVEKDSSFWTQNEGRLTIINHFKQTGYTAFYSNLYGRNWGSEKAVKLAKQLYFYITRHEILNEKIHIVAEGMGALIALKLVKEMNENIRSIVLLNPIYSLKNQLEHEKEHKFFYKKLLKEIAAAYSINVKEVEDLFLDGEWEPELPTNIPLKIIHILNGPRSYKQSRISSQLTINPENEGIPISVCYVLPEKRTQLHKYIIKFFNECEQIL